MTMTLQEAQAEYADASANYAAAKAAGDAETILAAKTQLAQAQAAVVRAKVHHAKESPESVAALKKENAELKAKVARLVNQVQEESDEKWAAFNKIRELEWALREAKGEKMPNFGAQTAIIPPAKKGYPPLKFDASDMFPDWDERP